jgi:hypothetical protein
MYTYGKLCGTLQPMAEVGVAIVCMSILYLHTVFAEVMLEWEKPTN